MTTPVPPFALVPASYVYLLRDHEILLQRRANTGYMDGCWAAGAAGHVEFGETAAQTAVREAFEELGVGVRAGDLSLITVMQETDGTADPVEQRISWFWALRIWTGEPRICEPAKCAELRWHSLDALPEPLPDVERWVIESLIGDALPMASAHGFDLTSSFPFDPKS